MAPPPGYEAEPKVFSESCTERDFPDAVKDSEYRMVAWLLIKICTVRKIRELINRGAVTWPPIEDIIEKREEIIKYAEGEGEVYENVMGLFNQFARQYAALATLRSPYTFVAYKNWELANGGVSAQFDNCVYHLTGFKRFSG